jgi:hypothetical protein
LATRIRWAIPDAGASAALDKSARLRNPASKEATLRPTPAGQQIRHMLGDFINVALVLLTPVRDRVKPPELSAALRNK